MLCAADRLLGEQVDVVVAGDPATEEARAMREVAIGPFVPNLVLTSVAAGDAHAVWPLYVGKSARDGRATAYACRGYSCDEPTDDPSRLAEQVRSLAETR
jgi:uncharacterized protein YyaL (SSP411 family)